MKYTLIIYLLIQTTLSAIGSWSVNNRSHPELKWKTIKTENFDIHYHEGIREIALSGASIAISDEAPLNVAIPNPRSFNRSRNKTV